MSVSAGDTYRVEVDYGHSLVRTRLVDVSTESAVAELEATDAAFDEGGWGFRTGTTQGTTADFDLVTRRPLSTAVGGGGSAAARLVASPTLHVGYSELAAGAALQQPVSLADGETITVYAWGARKTDGTTPTGLNVELWTDTGEVVESANTAWTADETGVAEWTNDTGERVDIVLAIANGTGSDYTDPEGVGGQFGYEVR